MAYANALNLQGAPQGMQKPASKEPVKPQPQPEAKKEQVKPQNPVNPFALDDLD